MQFEIIEAYELIKKPDAKPSAWSLHVYFPEMEMDVRGFGLLKRKSTWFLNIPTLRNYDPEQKKMIRFPII